MVSSAKRFGVPASRPLQMSDNCSNLEGTMMGVNSCDTKSRVMAETVTRLPSINRSLV